VLCKTKAIPVTVDWNHLEIIQKTSDQNTWAMHTYFEKY